MAWNFLFGDMLVNDILELFITLEKEDFSCGRDFIYCQAFLQDLLWNRFSIF